MTARVVPYTRILEEERFGRKQGVLAAAAVSVLSVTLTLPFVSWIVLVASYAESPPGVRGSYSVLNFLTYVNLTKQGPLGLVSMMLMVVAIGSMVMHAICLARVATKRYGGVNMLGFYALSRGAMILSFLASAGLVVFLFAGANKISVIHRYAPSPAPYLIILLSIIGFACVLTLERRERALNREHGFFEELRRNWILFFFLIPAVVFYLINNYLPMVGIYFAFTQFNFRDGLFGSPYVGLKNFEHLARAELFRLTRNTVLYNIVFICLGNVLQIVFAILVSRVISKWFKKASQTLIFMPYFVSFVILRVLVYNLLENNVGLINSIIKVMGGVGIDFYNTPSFWPYIITIFYIWKNLGYGMVVYLATIMGISDEFYEAARVDGANIYQQIRYITLPLLKPTFIILLLYSLGGIMRGQFELFFQLVGTNGVLFSATDIIDTFVYRITTTQPMSMGMGAAAGLYQSGLGFIIIMTTNYLIKRKNGEYALF